MGKNFDILLIDDEQVILNAVLRICKEEQISVDPMTDAVAALDRLKSNQYRLILCDLMLPQVDGFLFLDNLAERDIDIPVVMITGYSTVENAVKSLARGAIDFIPKPFTSEEIYSAIHRGLRFVDIRDQVRANIRGTSVYVSCPPAYMRLGYTSWGLKDQDGTMLIGVTDLYLKIIGSCRELELYIAGDETVQGTYCCNILTEGGERHSMMAPISGKIVEVNQRLIKEPTLVEKDPFFAGWLYRVIPSDIEYEQKFLMLGSKEL
ncbi:MAG: response regulator [Calditrichales bacterium]|nr:MAG: response regulator [Calditrichales bacterium]